MFNEELITAYLDGELTADEQAQVEQALASDARLRQMHDDMRALRNSLQALPQQTLDAGFVERVLLAARQAQAPHAAAESEVLVKTHQGHDTIVRHAQHEPLAWRVVVWTIAGLAAAVFVVLFLPKQTSEVARHTSTKDAPVDHDEAPQAAPQQPAAPLAKDAAGQPQVRAFATENAAESAEAGLEATTTPAPREAEPKMLMRAAPAPASAMRAAPQAEALAPADSARGAAPPAQQDQFAQAAASDQLLIVRLQVPAADFESRAIDPVLARHLGRAVTDKLNDAQAKGDVGTLKKQQLDDLSKQLAEVEADEQSDLVYVEATPEQLAATIDELSTQHGYPLSFASLDHEMQRNKDSLRDNASSEPTAPAASAPRDEPKASIRSFADRGSGGAARKSMQRRRMAADELAAPPAIVQRLSGDAKKEALGGGGSPRELKMQASEATPAPALANEGERGFSAAKVAETQAKAASSPRVRVLFVIEATDAKK